VGWSAVTTFDLKCLSCSETAWRCEFDNATSVFTTAAENATLTPE